MVLSGSYNNHHLNAGYLVNYMDGSFQQSGFFPTSNNEQDIMWWNGGNPGIGVTCFEGFFYLSSYPTDGNSNKLMFRARSQRTTNSGTNNFEMLYIRFDRDGDITVYVRRTSPSSENQNGTGTHTIIIPNMGNILNLNEWYHLVIRMYAPSPSSDNRITEVLIGNTGKNVDGTDHEGVASTLDGSNFATNNANGQYYFRASANSTDSEGGPLALFFKWNSNNAEDNSSTIRASIGTNGNSTGNLDNNAFPGGIADIRFWKSDIFNTKSYFELESNKNKPVVYSPDGDYPDLLHCFRLNETGVSLSAADYVDVGQYTGRFFDTHSNVNSVTPYTAGYPYDLASFVGDPPSPKYFSGHAAGHAEGIDFFGQQFATGIGEVPYYREALPAELGLVNPPDNFDQLAQNNTPVRIAIRDYYNGLVYLLPGTGTVQDDVPDDIDNDLGLGGVGLFVTTDVFYPLTGKDVVYSQFYLIENASLTEGLDNINFYASSISGPSIVVVNDSGVGFITESEALGG